MKKLTITTSAIATGLLITILTGCNIIHKPDINGSDRQPIMHGWTREQAGEYWLQATSTVNAPVQQGTEGNGCLLNNSRVLTMRTFR